MVVNHAKKFLKPATNKIGVIFVGMIAFATVFTQLNFDGLISLKTKNIEAASCVDRLIADESFNPGTGTNTIPNAYLIQPDGKIIIGGNFTNYNGNARNRLVRINPDGSLDNTFNIGTGFNSQVQSLALQPDGKIVVGGAFTSYNGTARNRLVRINPDGSLDTTFNTGTGPNGAGIQALALQSDGKLVIIGSNMTSYNGAARNRVARINSNGSLDTTFINSITFQPTPPSTSFFSSPQVAIQSDGKVLIAGLVGFPNPNSPQNMAASIRLNTNGSIDASYNHNLVSGQNWALYPTIQPDGKIIYLIRGSNDRLFRVNTDGSTDTSFNNPAQSGYYVPTLLSDGKILIGRGANIVRLNSNGSFDSSFVITMINGSSTFVGSYDQDKVLAIGSFTSVNNQTTRNRMAILEIEVICTYDLIYTSGSGGTLSGELEQPEIFHGGDGQPVLAIPNPGYQFIGWSDGRTDNPRIDTGVTSDISVTANFALASPCDVNSTDTSARITGYGWMGVNIETNPPSDESQGGGGWLKFGCESGQQDFGAKVNFDQNSPYYGKISGNAWSNNYGWLTFEEDLVQSCWANSPGETASSTATVLLGNTQSVTSTGTNLGSGGGAQGVNPNSSTELTLAGGTAVEGTQAGQNLINQVGTARPTGGVVQNTQPGQNLSNEVRPTRPAPGVLTNNPGASTSGVPAGNLPIVGWAKFINGDDFDNDGYTGCVSFSGSNYAVSLNPSTGALNGWAWGSDVVGWLSFQNPQCPFCDAEIDVPEIEVCEDPTATNYNLPGECTYGPPVPGCTDVTATNYNSAATEPDGSCTYDPEGPNPTPTLNLNVTPNSFTVGSPNQLGQFMATDINWTSNNPGQISPNSCVGSFSILSGGFTQTATLVDWTGPRANPNSLIPSIVIPQAASITNTNTQLVFTITCQSLDGDTLTATDNILFTENNNPVRATVDLRIEDPNSNPQGNNNFQILNAASGAMVTLGWSSENIISGSCRASSYKVGANAGSNNQWGAASNNEPVNDNGTRDGINMLTAGGIGNGVSTQFRITCTDISGLYQVSDTVNVCIADTACPVTQSGLFPSYQEF